MPYFVRTVLITAACVGASMNTQESMKLLDALRRSFPLFLEPHDRTAMEMKFFEALSETMPPADAVNLPWAYDHGAHPSLDCIVQRALQSLGIAGASRALTADEVHRLPIQMLDDLQAWWVSTQRYELTALGLPLQLFETHAVPESLRDKFVVSDGDGGELVFFDSKSDANDAAETAMLRNIGPIKAAYYAATGAPLPDAHVGLAAGIAWSCSNDIDDTRIAKPTIALDNLLKRALHSLGIAGASRALTADEVHRLPMQMLDDLQAWWVSTQRYELTALGLPLHLFETHAVPESLRDKFVVSDGDGGELVFFDSKSDADDAAETVMLRNIGPINAAYSAATGAPLPVAHVGVVAAEPVMYSARVCGVDIWQNRCEML